jgi:PTS system ascorbate-specific IIA component
MIEGFVLNDELIQIKKGSYSWPEAIEESSKPLVEHKYINDSYVEAMIKVVEEFGPYIVIAPNVAMPHARPEAGSKKVGFSVTVFEEEVIFDKDEDIKAKLFITLSCTTSDTHIKMIQALVEILGNDELVEKLVNSNNKEEILEIFR